MSDNFSEGKSNLPSHNVYLIKEGRKGKEQWHKVGAAWPSKDNGFTAETIVGRVVMRSRELEEMRAEQKQQNQSQQPAKSHDLNP